MYGGIVPHYIQRELARLRQENQLLRYKIASVAMSQPKRSAVRHQATQTAPALTFSTGRGRQWATRKTPQLASLTGPEAAKLLSLRLLIWGMFFLFFVLWLKEVDPYEHSQRDNERVPDSL
ncbi:Hypothetical protein (Fragment) [Durusdinium trenchii]|uniref:Uncharacterized protein n=1 Tax=Durusdinium trenchii TaxID=1381693 RepID=A0ABP0IBV4_9DINO